MTDWHDAGGLALLEARGTQNASALPGEEAFWSPDPPGARLASELAAEILRRCSSGLAEPAGLSDQRGDRCRRSHRS